MNGLLRIRFRGLEFLCVALILASVLVGCDGSSATTPTTPVSGPTSTSEPAASKLDVTASFYPLQYFAQRIGGDHVEVYNPVPPGAEPHDLELTPGSLERIQQAKVFLYLGHGFQPAIDRALDTIVKPGMIVKDVSEGVDLMPGAAHEEEEEEHAGETEGTETPGDSEEGTPHAEEDESLDPHIWLDPVLAQAIASNIAAALSQANPANKATYEANLEKLRSDLAALDEEYKAGLSNCKRKELITTHVAFAYLANRYGLEQVAISGLSPEAEPSPARLQEIIRFAREHDVKYIFFETLVDPSVAELIASEVGAQTLVLNPIEGLTEEQVKAGADYISLMRDNLANLKTGLECTN